MKQLMRRLLEEAKASNGGGVYGDKYPQVIAEAVCNGWIVKKKGCTLPRDLVVITKAGRDALESAAPSNSLQEIAETEWNRGTPPATTFATNAARPWED